MRQANKYLLVFLGTVALLGLRQIQPAFSQRRDPEKKMSVRLFYVYSDQGALENHFIPSGWMGDYADLIMDTGCKENPYAGDTCIKIVYKNYASQGARWAGIYWQDPANNWGTVPDAGYDLTGARELTFFARGEKGGERIEQFKVGGITGPYPDSATASIGPIVLTNEWQRYTIDLSGKDLTHIIGGFAWSTNLTVNPHGCTFYLDEIRFE